MDLASGQGVLALSWSMLYGIQGLAARSQLACGSLQKAGGSPRERECQLVVNCRGGEEIQRAQRYGLVGRQQQGVTPERGRGRCSEPSAGCVRLAKKKRR